MLRGPMWPSRATGFVIASNIDVLTMSSAVDAVFAHAAGKRSAYMCFATAHMLVEALHNPAIRAAYEGAHMVAPDGAPVAYCLRLLGFPRAQCVSGPRLVPKVLEEAEKRRVPVGFYGGRLKTLQKLQEKLASQYPDLKVVYMHSPPFRPLSNGEFADVVRDVRLSEVRILFVGLGSPKQEQWMRDAHGAFDCTLLGVGAAFDFLAGEKVMPPVWVQKMGLAWLVRLAQEPRRLAGRNLYSPLFVAHFLLQCWYLLISSKPLPRARE
jgi:N-acetylglucosaminyldiphosphoundecaprenol N-acetyl-beta-D-mannosaminyltransferase